MRLIDISGVAAVLLLAAAATPAAAEGGMTVLTVSGPTVSANRPPQTTEAEDLFSAHGIVFENGHAFDRDDLSTLGEHDVMKPLESQGQMTATVMQRFAGPRLVDVLKMAQAQGDTLSVTSADGVRTEIAFADLLDHGAILALELNGQPLGLGDGGPTMIVFEPAADAAEARRLSDLQAGSVFYIAVE